MNDLNLKKALLERFCDLEEDKIQHNGITLYLYDVIKWDPDYEALIANRYCYVDSNSLEIKYNYYLPYYTRDKLRPDDFKCLDDSCYRIDILANYVENQIAWINEARNKLGLGELIINEKTMKKYNYIVDKYNYYVGLFNDYFYNYKVSSLVKKGLLKENVDYYA